MTTNEPAAPRRFTHAGTGAEGQATAAERASETAPPAEPLGTVEGDVSGPDSFPASDPPSSWWGGTGDVPRAR